MASLNASIKPADAAPAEPAAAPDAPPADTAEPAAEQPKAYAHKLAALQIEAQKSKAELLKHKSSAEAAAARVAELEATLGAISKDPKAALKHAGMDPLAFAQALIDGKLQLDDVPAAPARDPEVQALIDEGKAARERAKEEATKAQLDKIRTDNLALVTAELAKPEHAEQFPLLLATPGANEKILQWIELEMDANGGVEPEFAAVAKVANDLLTKELAHYLKSDTAMRAVLKDPELLAAVKAALGAPAAAAEAPAPAAAKAGREAFGLAPKKPTTLTSAMANAVPSRSAKGTRADVIGQLNREVLGLTGG
jgi:hypothetical protein